MRTASYKAKDRARSRKPERRFRNGIKTAKERSLPWGITFEQYKVLVSQPCHYGNSNHSNGETGTGLDRIDRNKGYEIGNVVSCCGAHNYQKGKLELLGFSVERVLELMYELRNVPVIGRWGKENDSSETESHGQS